MNEQMINTVILLCHSQSARDALRKVVDVLFGKGHFTIPDLPLIPSELEANEFLVSEAMKLVCHENQRVLILGVDKSDVVEKAILCRRFHSLIEFVPYFDIFACLLNNSRQPKYPTDFRCEMSCTVFGRRCVPRNEYGNLYSGKIIYSICHQLQNRNFDKVSSAMPLVWLLRGDRLFIPPHGGQKGLVDSLLGEIEHLYGLGAAGEFKKKTSNILEKGLYNEFPYFQGDE